MTDSPRDQITRWLHDLEAGDADRGDAADRLYAAVYPVLRDIAAGLMRRERPDHTLQPTALVHEAYLRLVDQTRADWQDRAHFYGIAARAMRQILVDHARKHAAAKRGGHWRRVTLDEQVANAEQLSLEILAVNDALEALARQDERMAKVVELRVFGGLLAREAAHVLGVSKRTVDEDWRVARMMLGRALATDAGA
ncbi:MAG TPA: ECF-type sigma factor [Candidatus Krumholzibacteria bacterium]|nr:ECF-type sigma factor [Candidatus Krumholzibacteria bacterium]HPD72237.1 ECF-type sigma factor [Candidatus Krumholzibacteria bacterium]HRY40831.1 ECF-type sigma factor [Candidatus Krumholzibacteria bacterium]